MSKGVIELKVKCYLSIDAEQPDIDEFIEYLRENFIGNYDNKIFVEQADVTETS